MKLYHKIDEFLYHLFGVNPNSGTKEELIEKIREYYTLDDLSPQISEDDGVVVVQFDEELMEERAKFNEVISLCEKGEYGQAKVILDKLLEKNKTNSEYYRIYGQILSDEGDHEGAIDHLIDALKWNPENAYALIMMGNIYARDLDDVDTAQRYYGKTLEVDPKNHIAINNIAGNLMNRKKLKEARHYFNKALEIDSTYPNTHYGLAMIEHMEGNMLRAFDCVVKALENNQPNNQLFNQSIALARAIAKEIEKEVDSETIVNKYVEQLEKVAGKRIKIEESDEINTTAKLEIAEVYNRNYHLVKYKPNSSGELALVLHELKHLDLINQARATGNNKYFSARSNGIVKFRKWLKKWIVQIKNQGYPEESIDNVLKQMLDGINLQAYNAPIDLFIEDFIKKTWPEIRPIHFVAYLDNVLQSISATTREDVVNLFPKEFVSKSKIYSLVGALHFRELYGADLTELFKPSKKDIDTAESMYGEFNEYRYDKEPGEEYEIIQNWGNDLGLAPYFSLIKDNTSLDAEQGAEQKEKGDSIPVDEFLKRIEDDPFNLEGDQSEMDSKMTQFIETQKAMGINPAVVMYMVDAIRYFEAKPVEKVKEIAFEIAMMGRMGIDPKEKGYKVGKIPGKEFTGYHLLAYYYVSWAIAIPEMVSQLQMPFDKEYDLAKRLNDEG